MSEEQNKSYEMQIRFVTTKDGKQIKEFKSIRCSPPDAYTYRYKTRKAAEHMLNICYPNCEVMPEDKRVIQVNKPANMSS